MSGDRYELGFGYYVVKNNPDTSVSNTIARREEEAYFEEEDLWSTKLNKHEDRFGTAKLVTALSQKLTEQIRTRYVLLDSGMLNKRSNDWSLVYLTSENR